ncbi:MAG: UvrD-helicase domain-containing protein [Firmicutes bacterium]|nr:UvrD-helicase domain-containing protein [Bacillota bacterium]
MSYELKPEQRQAIELRDKNILVSASAGSGKTFVLIERILSLILNDKADLENMLVVTFTNAAATDVKLKLENRLSMAAADTALPADVRAHAYEQLNNLPGAQVSTFHAFCKKLITRYIYITPLDNDFTVADVLQAQALAAEACMKTIESACRQNSEEFKLLRAAFSGKRNLNALGEIVLELHEFLVNQTDMQKLNKRIEQLYSADLDNNPACKILLREMLEFSDTFAAGLHGMKLRAEQAKLDKLAVFIGNIIVQLEAVNKNKSFLENRSAVENINLGRMWKPAAEPEEEFKLEKEKLSKRLSELKELLLSGLTSDRMIKDLAETKLLVHYLVCLAEEFKNNYNVIKRQNNIADFNDLETIALQVLSSPEAVKEVQNEFKYVFVDEFQDTNDVQEAIIDKVAGKNNLFVVGDVKQSIYGFRNTNPDIFNNRHTGYKQSVAEPNRAVELNYNFRSDNGILQFVNYIFYRIMTVNSGKADYKNTGMFKEGQKLSPEQKHSVEVNIIKSYKSFEPDDAEGVEAAARVYSVADSPLAEDDSLRRAKTEAKIIASYLAERVNRLNITDSRTGLCRKMQYGDAVILVRSQNEYNANVQRELVRLGVPISLGSKNNLLDFYEVQVLHGFISLLSNSKQDLAMACVCMSDIIGLDENEMCAIRKSGAEKEFFAAAEEYVNRNDDKIAHKLKRLYNYINRCRNCLITESLYSVMLGFVNDTGWLSLSVSLEGGAVRAANINSFLMKLLTVNSLNDLNGYIKTIGDNSGKLTEEQTSEYNANAVRVETMHKSKGREFPFVILAGLGSRFNIDSRKGDLLLDNKLGIGLYNYDIAARQKHDTIVRSGIKLNIASEDFSEEIRLFYVACTRAKYGLMLCGSVNPLNIVSRPDCYALKRLDSFMSLFCSVLKPDEIAALRSDKKRLSLTINSGKACEFRLNAHSVNEFNEAERVSDSIKVYSLSKANYEETAAYSSYCNFVYPYQSATRIAGKNSVVKLMQEFDSETDGFALVEGDAAESLGGSDAGSAYHYAMEVVDFGLESEQEIKKYLSDKLTADELKFIECGKILKCLCALKNLGAEQHGNITLREQRFYMLEEHSRLVPESECNDKILVQGIIDLIIRGDDKTILVDYKTTRAKTPQELAEKYRIQLQAYKIAAEGSLNCKLSAVYIYSFYFDKLIMIDI